jgi:ubiquinone/menaquinone biosynthesis C-methylase UbiE
VTEPDVRDATSLADAYSATGAAWQAGPGRIYDRLADTLLDHAPSSMAGRLALDVGAGTGAASRAIRRAGGTPIALDLARGMLAFDQGHRPPAVVSDARRLPIASGTCGAVVAAFSYNHLTDPERALAEGRRVLAPGGFLLASAYANGDSHPVKDAVDRAAQEMGWRQDPWVTSLKASAIPHLATVEGAQRAVLAAGLAAEVRAVDVAFPELDAEQLVAWRMGMAQVAPFLAARTDAERRFVANRALELLGEPEVLVRRIIVIAATG